MKLLKFLVIFMAVLIVAGIAFLIYTISTGLHLKNKPIATDSANTVLTVPLDHNISVHNVTLADNQILKSYHIDQGLLILHIQNEHNEQVSWQVINLTNGKTINTIKLH